MKKVDEWPLWLQVLVGIPNAVGLTWALVYTPKTQKGLRIVYGFMCYMFLFFVFFVWQSFLGYVATFLITFGVAVALFLRARNAQNSN